MFIFNTPSNAQDCIKELRCYQKKCNNGYEGHVMFVDANYSFCEVEAAKLEITVDYYLAEFI